MNSGTLIALAGALVAWGGLCVYLWTLAGRLQRALAALQSAGSAPFAAPTVTIVARNSSTDAKE